MDRLLAIEPKDELSMRFEVGQKSTCLVQLTNLMYTMPVAFKLQTSAPKRYGAKPAMAIIPPLGTTTVEIASPPMSDLPEKFPFTSDKLVIKSVLAPSGAQQESLSSDWFSSKRTHVYIDADLKIVLVGSGILLSLIRSGSIEEVREVLERNVDVNSIDTLGNTAMHVAISKKRPEMVQLLLEFGCNLEKTNKSGYTALHEGAMAGDPVVAELLLTKGAVCEARTPSGHTALHHAVGRGYLEVVRVLLEKGADVNAVGNDGRTALYIAAVNGDREAMRLLMENGADVEAAGPDGSTALHKASSKGNSAMVMLLLSWGADKDVINSQGKTPYDLAVDSGHANLWDMLKMGNMLRSSARKGDLKSVRQCLSRGAQVNGQDQYGWSALHYAAFKGHSKVVSFLIEQNADIESRDEEGYTALHCATEACRKDIVQLMISKGADLDVRTKQGPTALQIANTLNYPGLIRVLSEGRARSLVRGGLLGSKLDANTKDTVFFERIPSFRRSSSVSTTQSIDYSCATVA